MKKKDTTVKLDGSLVEEVANELERGETLTSYVRKAVRYRVRHSRMRRAAMTYQEATEADPDLANELADWEGANLAGEPGKDDK